MGGHVRIHPQCGACGFTFTEYEAVVALCQEGDDAIAIASSTLEYRHTANCDGICTLGRVYCRYPDCKECASSAPTVTIHEECLDFLEQLTTAEDKLSWLWTAATWRSPWNGAPPLQQALSPVIDAGQFIDRAAQACEMPGLSSLPKELALMIYEQSDRSCLHRCLAFWSYARWWNRSHQKMPKTIPIEEIEEWHRGSHPVMNKGARHGEVESDVQKPIIILSIDFQGLRSITRVQKGDTTSYTNANDNLLQSDTVVYVVEAAECFASAQVEYNYPFARLQLTGRPEQFRVWDTPSPPQWQECVVDTDYDSASRAKSHLSTIDTRSTTGLTFFTCFARIWAIHAHTNRRPSAQSTFDMLSPKIQAFVHWIHVPFGSEDKLTAFGWSHTEFNARFFLRLKLAGDIIVGSTYKMNDENVQLIQHPLTLIYERPDSEGVHVVGGHAGGAAPLAAMQLEADEAKDAEAEPTFTFQYRKQPFRSASYSSAPLSNVIRTHVFYGKHLSTLWSSTM
ncbi:hypothetical protein TGAM01_v210367 [Trichoderma gamsii]|uniref:Uncharacterized protein n=1 Tax=Trichoderma gamsii TaxID=398673 RepID=A0A2P4Z917_9HYPO|nr:hypothetical protein TGAM01_v210367 [Trichoderma gamsii]PON20766.1 hypothetical protein TGAM01_v210367 [Trichoderma gamsii]